MLKQRSMPWIAAALLTLLTGCGNVSRINQMQPVIMDDTKAARQMAMALMCPTPTDGSKAAKIATYLEGAKPDPNLDVLATEWERLDDGSRSCRIGKVAR